MPELNSYTAYAVIAVLAITSIFLTVALLKSRSATKRERRAMATASKAIVEYFRKTGVGVSVSCVSLHHDGKVTAFVESEPMKQFRLSHIIEMSLREHLSKSLSLELERVFWRFPIKVAARESDAAVGKDGKSKATSHDDYINEGLVNYKDLPKFEATEIPWEKFEEVVTQEGPIQAEPETGKP